MSDGLGHKDPTFTANWHGMKAHGIVDSGEATERGIGAMTDAHMASFFDKMVKAGVVKAGLDYRKAYTLRFVNKKVGIDLRRN